MVRAAFSRSTVESCKEMRQKTMKKIALTIVSLMLALVMSSCGSASNTAARQEAAQSSAAQETTATDAPVKNAAEADSVGAPVATDTMAPEAAVQSQDALSEAVNSSENTESEETTEATTASAVVCFSGTGTTWAIAEMMAEATGSDLYEITPAEPYSDADLNYNDDDCRANQEQDDPDARPEIANDLSAVTNYETIYLGYPIWWGTNPRIVQTFLESYDLGSVKIYTFCTSGGSGIEQSVSDLQENYPDLNIISGKRLNNASEADIEDWISSLE